MDINVAPEEMAQDLVDSAEVDWLRELVDALDRQVRVGPLQRLNSLWDLSNAGAARLFGVTRQAYAKWVLSGPPPSRADDVARVAMITDVLDRYVRRERIPAVVRRQAPMLGNQSIIEVLEAGRYQDAAAGVAAIFDLRRVQP
ncbi:MAG: hypothetical protein ACR2NL_06690 [Acidimicrobiia bacterium]